MDEMKKRVLVWLRTRDPNAARIIDINGAGSDWSGSTESGFYETFAVDIAYARRDDEAAFLSVSGEEMASLWHRLMSPVD